ncbi:MAG: hypothetical protein ABFC57_13055 [Veillonellales bacterium]
MNTAFSQNENPYFQDQSSLIDKFYYNMQIERLWWLQDGDNDIINPDLGFGDRIADGDWSDVTTVEVGSMVREAIKRGETAIAQEAAINGKVHQNEE